MFKGGCARSQIATETDAHEGDASGIHFRPPQQSVDHRRHHLLPIRAERQMLFAEESALTRSFKGEAVIASLDGCGGDHKVEFFPSRIVPTMHHQGRTWMVGIVRPVVIPWKKGSLIRNEDLLHRDVHQFDRLTEGG